MINMIKWLKLWQHIVAEMFPKENMYIFFSLFTLFSVLQTL